MFVYYLEIKKIYLKEKLMSLKIVVFWKQDIDKDINKYILLRGEKYYEEK